MRSLVVDFSSHDVDEKQVDLDGMTTVTVKCIDRSWTNGSESGSK